MRKINEHPLPIILGALASIIGILYTLFVFTTGKTGMFEENKTVTTSTPDSLKEKEKTKIEDSIGSLNSSEQNTKFDSKDTVSKGKVKESKSFISTEKTTDNNDINYSLFLPKKYVGYFKNTTYVDNENSSFCEIELNYDSQKRTFRLKGKTDNVNLFGTWDLEGVKIIQQGKQMVHFSGKFDYGTDTEGNKVATTMSMLVSIEKNSIVGTYGIAPIEKYGTIPEKGTLELH